MFSYLIDRMKWFSGGRNHTMLVRNGLKARVVLLVSVMGVAFFATHSYSQATDAGEPTDQSYDQLFEQAFGVSAPDEPEEIIVPVLRGAEIIGEAGAELRSNRILINTQDLLNVVRPIVSDQTMEALSAKANERRLVEITEFRTGGVLISYDEMNVQFSIRFEASALKRRTLEGGAIDRLPAEEPSPFSGYINMFGRFNVSGTNREVGFTASPVINVLGWVGRGRFDWSLNQQVSIDEARIVHDFVNAQLRVSGGTINTDSIGFSGNPTLWGVSVERVAETLPSRQLQMGTDVDFVSPDSGQVKLFLNDHLYRSFWVDSGPYTIPDLPLGQGINEVRVMMEDQQRSIELARFRRAYDPRLLKVWKNEYQYAAGVFRSEPTEPIFHGYHRLGVHPQLTLESTLQSTLNAQFLSLGSVFAWQAGITSLETAVTRESDAGFGWKGTISQTWASLYAEGAPVLRLSTGASSPHSTTITGGGLVDQNESWEWRLGFSLNQKLPWAGYLSLGIGYSDGDKNQTAINISYQQEIRRAVFVSLDLNPRFQSDHVQWGGSALVRIRPENADNNVSIRYDLNRGPASITYSPIVRNMVRRPVYSATLQGFDRTEGRSRQFSLNGSFRGYRFESGLQPLVAVGLGDSDTTWRVTGRLGSAVVWAWPVFSVSRPVRDSFVVYGRDSSLKDYSIGIQPSGTEYSGMISWLPGVYPELRSYANTSVQIDTNTLPPGFGIGETRHRFSPGYHQGYLIQVGETASVYCVGNLLDAAGDPIGPVAGEVVDQAGNAILFFADQDGKFEIHGLKPGEYRMYLFDYPESEALFGVPENETGRYDLEQVVFLTGEEQL